jgi:hypothetical protein
MPLGGLPGDVAEELLDSGDQGLIFFVRGSVYTSPRYATLKIVKWINIMRAKRPDLPPFRHLSVEDVENCLNED